MDHGWEIISLLSAQSTHRVPADYHSSSPCTAVAETWCRKVAAYQQEPEEARNLPCWFFFSPVCLNATGVRRQLDGHSGAVHHRPCESRRALWVAWWLNRRCKWARQSVPGIRLSLWWLCLSSWDEGKEGEGDMIHCHFYHFHYIFSRHVNYLWLPLHPSIFLLFLSFI